MQLLTDDAQTCCIFHAVGLTHLANLWHASSGSHITANTVLSQPAGECIVDTSLQFGHAWADYFRGGSKVTNLITRPTYCTNMQQNYIIRPLCQVSPTMTPPPILNLMVFVSQTQFSRLTCMMDECFQRSNISDTVSSVATFTTLYLSLGPL